MVLYIILGILIYAVGFALSYVFAALINDNYPSNGPEDYICSVFCLFSWVSVLALIIVGLVLLIPERPTLKR